VIPKEIAGKPVDVMEVGDVFLHFLDRTKRHRPFPMGVSIGHKDITAGTAGFMAYEPKLKEFVLCSNNHVLANVNKGKQGDPILQPGPYDKGTVENDKVGILWRYVPIKIAKCKVSDAIVKFLNILAHLCGSRFRFRFRPERIPKKEKEDFNKVDCAIARLFPDIWDATLADLGTPRGINYEPQLGMKVLKSGRTTQVTEGKIKVLDYEGWVGMDKEGKEWAYFEDQILIENIGNKPFSQPGDSGSCVVDGNLNIVGLLFAGNDKVTLVNKIVNVFEELEISWKEV